MVDLDTSGNPYQTTKVYMGPSLGWVQTQIKPQVNVTAAGTVTVAPGTSLIMVNVAGSVTINLPDVSKWILETAYNPATAFDRSIWIKDIGAHASSFPITVVPFDTQNIDGTSISYTIIQDLALLRLYPLNDLTGWFSG